MDLLTFLRRQLSHALETLERFLGGSVNLLTIVVMVEQNPINLTRHTHTLSLSLTSLIVKLSKPLDTAQDRGTLDIHDTQ